MTILDFYEGGTTPEGHSLETFLNYNSFELESHHDYIQWVFPTTQPSSFHDAPILTEEEIRIFRDSYRLKINLLIAFEKILYFYEFKLEDGKIIPLVEIPWVLKEFNHNHLRITRILTSLTLLGFKELADEFLIALKQFNHLISENTMSFWDAAVQEQYV